MIGLFRGGFEGVMRDCCLFAIPETVELHIIQLHSSLPKTLLIPTAPFGFNREAPSPAETPAR